MSFSWNKTWLMGHISWNCPKCCDLKASLNVAVTVSGFYKVSVWISAWCICSSVRKRNGSAWFCLFRTWWEKTPAHLVLLDISVWPTPPPIPTRFVLLVTFVLKERNMMFNTSALLGPITTLQVMKFLVFFSSTEKCIFYAVYEISASLQVKTE